jgi:hypothetical protein
MFETDDLSLVEVIAELQDAGLVDVMAGAVRMERAVAARRLFAVAELFLRREAAREAEERENWRVDGWESVAAEVASAQGISRHKAVAQIQVATTLREELPEVAEVFAKGLVDYWIVALIVSRTMLIQSEDDMAAVDAALARQVHRWNRLSKKKIGELIDALVISVDHLAKRRAESRDEGRHIGIGPAGEGTAEVWGSLRAADAAAFDARLDELAQTVCSADPRTKEQLRADATGAMAAQQDRLACHCGREDCPAGDPPASNVVVHVIADAATVSGAASIPGYIRGYGAVAPQMLRHLLRGAKIQRVVHPGEVKCERGYRPSAALAEFVRCRDLTCRFPGCDTPAEVCDIDHTVPWPYGPAHPSNLKLVCRVHHLLKTFHNEWRDSQQPDGTVRWTAPTGHSYVTKPHGALFFPQLSRPTGEVVSTEVPAGGPGRGSMMPRRIRTRAEDRQARIDHERALNYQEYLLRPPPPPEEPPPF